MPHTQKYVPSETRMHGTPLLPLREPSLARPAESSSAQTSCEPSKTCARPCDSSLLRWIPLGHWRGLPLEAGGAPQGKGPPGPLPDRNTRFIKVLAQLCCTEVRLLLTSQLSYDRTVPISMTHSSERHPGTNPRQQPLHRDVKRQAQPRCSRHGFARLCVLSSLQIPIGPAAVD
jgi:hypothetical protein